MELWVFPNLHSQRLEVSSWEKRKVAIGWPAHLKRSPPKATFNNNDIYVKSTESSKNLYEEPNERKIEEDQGAERKT